jgi:hypothetical protein
MVQNDATIAADPNQLAARKPLRGAPAGDSMRQRPEPLNREFHRAGGPFSLATGRYHDLLEQTIDGPSDDPAC